jgi:UDP-N-acetylmuramate dehydrogenase
MVDHLAEELRRLVRGDILPDCPLDQRTTYRIGGPAKLLLRPQDIDDLQQLDKVIKERAIPKFVLGGGANILVSDEGFSGVAIDLAHFDKLTFEGSLVRAGAGLMLDELVVSCLKRGLAGLERLSGIPGTLGGALRMNAGAFDAEVSDHLVQVEILEHGGPFMILKKAQVGFDYRDAPGIKDRYILGASFDFPGGDTEELLIVRQEILARRREKQPWQYPSAGSVFKRPPDRYAGKLIEDAGLRGKILGRAQISHKHAGIIINLGGAKASEVLGLIRLAQSEVLQKFDVELELEQELIGF